MEQQAYQSAYRVVIAARILQRIQPRSFQIHLVYYNKKAAMLSSMRETRKAVWLHREGIWKNILKSEEQPSYEGL